jgi:DNA-binding GntR family transcriptional regulator
MSPVNTQARLRRATSTPDVIAETLREEILRGEVAPGQALRQEELAERFGVSRLPVRDALLRLEAQGLVHVYPNRGAFVISLSADEVTEIFEMRILLEGDIIERAVPRMTAEHWRRIDAAHAEATRTAGGPEWVEGDWRFHRTLYEAAERPRQLATIENLRSTVARYSSAYDALPTRTPEWLADHDAILEACRARAAVAAKQRLVQHLRRALALVLTKLEGESASG